MRFIKLESCVRLRGLLTAKHLVQLGVAVGVGSRGGVRSHARRALEAGATEKEIMQTVLLSTTIIGFPSMIAAYGWIQDVLPPKDLNRAPG